VGHGGEHAEHSDTTQRQGDIGHGQHATSPAPAAATGTFMMLDEHDTAEAHEHLAASAHKGHPGTAAMAEHDPGYAHGHSYDVVEGGDAAHVHAHALDAARAGEQGDRGVEAAWEGERAHTLSEATVDFEFLPAAQLERNRPTAATRPVGGDNGGAGEAKQPPAGYDVAGVVVASHQDGAAPEQQDGDAAGTSLASAGALAAVRRLWERSRGMIQGSDQAPGSRARDDD
jgi:hypothetical protein